jgi:hypothetical protein
MLGGATAAIFRDLHPSLQLQILQGNGDDIVLLILALRVSRTCQYQSVMSWKLTWSSKPAIGKGFVKSDEALVLLGAASDVYP